jgi:hypothetical protein
MHISSGLLDTYIFFISNHGFLRLGGRWQKRSHTSTHCSLGLWRSRCMRWRMATGGSNLGPVEQSLAWRKLHWISGFLENGRMDVCPWIWYKWHSLAFHEMKYECGNEDNIGIAGKWKHYTKSSYTVYTLHQIITENRWEWDGIIKKHVRDGK